MTATDTRVTPRLAPVPAPPAMRPADPPPGTDEGFEQRLIDGIRPIAEHFLASALHHLFNTGVYDHLAAHGPVAIGELATTLGFDEERLRGFLLFLLNEDVVTIDAAGRVALTARARSYDEFRAWYTMFVGGYSTTLDQLGAALAQGAPPCTRNGRYVGLGSCEISRYDGMPMTQSLLADAGVRPRSVLDLGCGNALYLVEFCRQFPGITAWGADPDRGSYDEALDLVASAGLGDRIELRHVSATEFLADPPPECEPDLIVFGYVLQEILGQSGEQAVVDALQATVTAFPRINIAVIEVAHEAANPAVMRHGTARNFWNPYYLIHPFTAQRLETRAFWERLFATAGLSCHAAVTTPANVDSSGVEIGYLLRGPLF